MEKPDFKLQGIRLEARGHLGQVPLAKLGNRLAVGTADRLGVRPDDPQPGEIRLMLTCGPETLRAAAEAVHNRVVAARQAIDSDTAAFKRDSEAHKKAASVSASWKATNSELAKAEAGLVTAQGDVKKALASGADPVAAEARVRSVQAEVGTLKARAAMYQSFQQEAEAKAALALRTFLDGRRQELIDQADREHDARTSKIIGAIQENIVALESCRAVSDALSGRDQAPWQRHADLVLGRSARQTAYGSDTGVHGASVVPEGHEALAVAG